LSAAANLSRNGSNRREMADVERNPLRKERFLVALLETPTVKEAAARAGVSERTAYRWVSDEDFAERWRAEKRRRVEASLERLEFAAGAAVECLVRNMRCGMPSVEVRAATAVLDLGIRATELLEMEDRVRAMERRMGEAALSGKGDDGPRVVLVDRAPPAGSR